MRSEAITPVNEPRCRPAPARGRSGWLLAGLGVVLFSLAAGIGCTPVEQRNGEETDLAALPQEVRDAVDRAAQVFPQPLSGARWSKVFALKKTDHPLYQLQGTNDRNNKVEMEVTGAGRIIEVEEHGIPLADVPSAVLKALQDRRPNFKPIQVEAIYQGGEAQPSVTALSAGCQGRTIEVSLSADGKTLLN
jgi:hypothetical protein